MRLILLAAALVAVVAGALHFGPQYLAFQAGLDRVLGREVAAMAFLAVGLVGWRLGLGGLLSVLIMVVGAAGASAMLTGRGLDLPEMAIAAPAALAIAGALAAWATRPPSGLALLAAAFVGVTQGHALTDGFAAARDSLFLGGVAAGAAGFALVGCLLGELVAKVAPGVAERLGAALGGVGLYLALKAAGVL